MQYKKNDYKFQYEFRKRVVKYETPMSHKVKYQILFFLYYKATCIVKCIR